MPKIYRQLTDKAKLCITAQAKTVMECHEINEEKFIKKLEELFDECCVNLEFPFHRVLVSKSSFNQLSYSLRIEIYDAWKKEAVEKEET
jgi:hypothetical protein